MQTIFMYIGIAVSSLALIGILYTLVNRIFGAIENGRFQHDYELESVIYKESDSQAFDSTYKFVCRKCGKTKTINVRGLDKWLSKHM